MRWNLILAAGLVLALASPVGAARLNTDFVLNVGVPIIKVTEEYCAGGDPIILRECCAAGLTCGIAVDIRRA